MAFAQVIEYVVVVAGLAKALPDVDVAFVQPAEQDAAFVDVQVSVEVAPRFMVLGFATRVTIISGVPPPPPAGAIVTTKFLLSVPQVLVALRVIVKVPDWVGVPLIVLPLNVHPSGMFSAEYAMVEVEVDEAEMVYEKEFPTFPFAVSELVIVGTSHTGGRAFTVTVAVAVAVVCPLVQVMV